jgi:hypothetical protein
VAGGDLGEVDVGLEAEFFDLGDPLAGEGVVEVFGDGVRLERARAAPLDGR